MEMRARHLSADDAAALSWLVEAWPTYVAPMHEALRGANCDEGAPADARDCYALAAARARAELSRFEAGTVDAPARFWPTIQEMTRGAQHDVCDLEHRSGLAQRHARDRPRSGEAAWEWLDRVASRDEWAFGCEGEMWSLGALGTDAVRELVSCPATPRTLDIREGAAACCDIARVTEAISYDRHFGPPDWCPWFRPRPAPAPSGTGPTPSATPR